MAVQETSKHAYKTEVLPTLSDRQRALYEELEKAENLTDAELAGRLVWPINTVTPRRNELMHMGHVVKATIRRCRVTGREVIAWKICYETLFEKPKEKVEGMQYMVCDGKKCIIYNVPQHLLHIFHKKHPNATKVGK